jgi:hypothetical protein
VIDELPRFARHHGYETTPPRTLAMEFEIVQSPSSSNSMAQIEWRSPRRRSPTGSRPYPTPGAVQSEDGGFMKMSLSVTDRSLRSRIMSTSWP